MTPAMRAILFTRPRTLWQRLFPSGTQGDWFNISDLASMWQESTGATPAAVNQPVGKITGVLGNRTVTQSTAGTRPTLRGTPTGSNLVADPRFYDGSGWTAGDGWTVAKPAANATLASSDLSYTLAAVAAQVYLITYTVTRSAGSVALTFGGTAGTSRALSGNYYEFVTAADTTALKFTGTGFSGSVTDIEVYDADAANVGAPYFLDGAAKFLTGSIALAAYPMALFARTRNQATASTTNSIGVSASGTNYKAINARGSIIDRAVSTLTATIPDGGTPVGRDEFDLGLFEAAAITPYGNGVVGTPTANTNTFTAQTTLSVGTTASLSLTGAFYSGGVLDRVPTEADRRSLVDYFDGNKQIQFWGDSMTLGLGTGVTASFPTRVSYQLHRVISNKGVGGETSSQILTRFQADASERTRWINVWQSGENDTLTGGLDTIKAAIASFAGGVQGSGRYLILGATMAAGSGTITAENLDDLDDYLLATYGSRFVDYRAYLQARNDGSVDDLADVAAGLVPRSLRSDTVHLNDLGYQYMADVVCAAIRSLGW
jgi:lysophospholipase L1-like esterase